MVRWIQQQHTLLKQTSQSHSMPTAPSRNKGKEQEYARTRCGHALSVARCALHFTDPKTNMSEPAAALCVHCDTAPTVEVLCLNFIKTNGHVVRGCTAWLLSAGVSSRLGGEGAWKGVGCSKGRTGCSAITVERGVIRGAPGSPSQASSCLPSAPGCR